LFFNDKAIITIAAYFALPPATMNNIVPQYGATKYKPCEGDDVICDYTHDTRCDGNCLTWRDDFLLAQLYPEEKICFPSFDEVYGNCSMRRTNIENFHNINPDQAKMKRAATAVKMSCGIYDTPEKLLPDGSNKVLSDLEQRSLNMLVQQCYEETDLCTRLAFRSETAFVTHVPYLCECYRTPLFQLTQQQFYKRVVKAFEEHPNRAELGWESSQAIDDAELPTLLLQYYP
jgi:hypothetical protein